MRSTCGLGRLLSAGAMGFVGASPLHNVLASWLGAAVGVSALVVWTKWLGHATACDVASTRPREEPQRVDGSNPDRS